MAAYVLTEKQYNRNQVEEAINKGEAIMSWTMPSGMVHTFGQSVTREDVLGHLYGYVDTTFKVYATQLDEYVEPAPKVKAFKMSDLF